MTERETNQSAPRDARLRQTARDKIRYELDGAAKDGLSAPARGADESWDELCLGRDILELLRERDHWKAAVSEIDNRYRVVR